MREMKQTELNQVPPIERLFLLPDKPPYGKLCLVRLHRRQWKVRKLFMIGNMEWRDSALSPDGQYYYMVGDHTYLGKVGQPKLRTLAKAKVFCVFSPNNRYLCGYNRANGSIQLFDCQTGRAKTLIQAEAALDTESEYSYRLGWYSDSRSIWYTATWTTGDKRPTSARYYRQDIQTGRRQLLNTPQVKNLNSDWDLLNPRHRFWHPHLQGDVAYAYAPTNQVRVKVAPHHIYSLDHPDDKSNVWLEWRGKGSRLLLKAGSHAWAKIHPQDVSKDGRWVLLVCGRWGKPIAGQRQLEYELVVIETKSLKILYPFQRQREKYAQVLPPNPLKQAYWIGKT